MDWHSIPKVAKMVKLSKQAVYLRLKKMSLQERKNLGEHFDEKGVLRLSDEGIRLLFWQSSGVKQPVNLLDEKINDAVVKELRDRLGEKNQEVNRLDGILTKVLSQLDEEQQLRREEQRLWAEERTRADTIIMKLTQDVGNLQMMLESRPAVNDGILKTPPKPIVAWEPPQRTDPMEGASWLQRFFASLFYPETLRSGAD